MKIEAGKIIPGLNFFLHFGTFPSNPDASLKVNARINKLREEASNLPQGYREKRVCLWEEETELIGIAEQFGIHLL